MSTMSTHCRHNVPPDTKEPKYGPRQTERQRANVRLPLKDGQPQTRTGISLYMPWRWTAVTEASCYLIDIDEDFVLAFWLVKDWRFKDYVGRGVLDFAGNLIDLPSSPHGSVMSCRNETQLSQFYGEGPTTPEKTSPCLALLCTRTLSQTPMSFATDNL